MAELLAANQITIAKVLDGEQGIPGEPGADGKTSYFHIKYSAVSNPTSSSEMSETPQAYIGTYVDFIEADSTDPTKYTWSRFEGIQGEKGEQGIPGIGQDGRTSYLHIAYATSADGSEGFSISESANKTYIGQYTDFVSTDSTDYTKYSWTKIKGEMSAEQLAQLNQASTNASQAKSDASTAKTTASAAKESIDNLEIGGRNFVPNSGTYIGWSKNAAFEILDGGALGNKQIKCSGFASGARLFANINITKLFPDKEFFTDTTFTISAYVKCDSVLTSTNTSIFARFEHYDGSEQFKEVAAWIPIDTDISGWTKISASYKFPKGTFTSAFVRIALGDIVDVYVSSIKLETGSRATDWTPAPEDVDAGINNAAKVATNFLGYDSTNGLIIGNKTSGSWSGYRSQILPTSFNILNASSTVLASYGASKIELGKNSVSSIIEMCGGMARVSARNGGLTNIYSNNGGYQTTLDYDFNETVFKSKVGSNYGSYGFIYSGGVWECSYSGNNAGYVQVNLSDYGITLKTTSVNEYAGITIQYWNGSEATFINADTTKPSRKLILGLAESGTSDNTDYAAIEIERSEKGNVEQSKINLLTVHDGANVAAIYLNNGDIALDASGEVRINNIPLDYIVEQGTYIGWKYRKWNSGIAECFGYISLGSISVSAVNNVYRGTATVTLPGLFNDIPSNVHITNGNPLSSVISINGKATDADHVSVYVWKATSGAVDSVYASFHVIGTWK